MAMVEAPQFNPLYLCSGTGQGKTHLLQAIAQDYAAAHPTANIILMSAEKFMLEFVGAMRGGDMLAFKARLRAEIGRAHVCTPVTNAQLVCRIPLAKNKQRKTEN